MADLNMPDREHGPALAIMSDAMKPHPAAEMFPLIAGIDFDALVADIRDNGQREPIVIFDNMILDGRHRYRACLQLGIEPAVIEWNGKGTPEFFVLSMNLHRRHLSESQRATIAAKIATRPPHRQKDKAANLPPSQAEAAEMLNVSERSVRNAATVIAKGSPEMVQALERGDIKAYAAAQLVNLSKARQKEIVAAGGKVAAREAAKAAKAKAVKLEVITPPEVAALPMAPTKSNIRRVTDDPEFQAEAEAAARDLEIERDERIALSGAGELAAENERLQKQVAMLDRRIAALIEENGSLKYRAKMWCERAKAAGWKGRGDG